MHRISYRGVELTAGTHDVMIAVGQGGGGWGFFFDVRGYVPLPESIPISVWYVTGPYNEGFDEVFVPEASMAASGTQDLLKTFTAKDGSTVGWEEVTTWNVPKKYHDLRDYYQKKSWKRVDVQQCNRLCLCGVYYGQADGLRGQRGQ